MGFATGLNDEAIGNGGAGNPGVWDIISHTSHDLGGRIVTAFMSLDEEGGTMDAMEEQVVRAREGDVGVSEAVAAKYLGYTYPQNIPFEGRYTLLTPTTGCLFKVWFLK